MATPRPLSSRRRPVDTTGGALVAWLSILTPNKAVKRSPTKVPPQQARHDSLRIILLLQGGGRGAGMAMAEGDPVRQDRTLLKRPSNAVRRRWAVDRIKIGFA